ncbi:Beta-barrel assembly-enhancing protease [bacterium HR15]|nr:Beta-barrel assembly-enhancing protease [bacterium HR15]
MRRTGKWRWLLLLPLAGLALTGCKGTLWSKKDEVRIGKEVSLEVEKAYKLDPNPAHQQRVQLIGQRLLTVAKVEPYEYTFKVLDSEEVNAFALPGGPVYVMRGLLEMVGNDDDELACVIGHELAHINRRHAAKQVTRGTWASVLIALGTKGKVRDIAEISAALLQLKYSRNQEYEADRLGLEYAYQSGYDPNGMIRFFQKLLAKQKEGDKGILANLRTHPLTENRIWRARQHIEKLTGKPAQEAKP